MMSVSACPLFCIWAVNFNAKEDIKSAVVEARAEGESKNGDFVLTLCV
jgi:hypothetical protein